MPATQSRLLSLPAELRNHIYEIIGIQCLYMVAQPYPKPADADVGTQALLLTCKQIRSDFKAVIRTSTPHVLDVEYGTEGIKEQKPYLDPATDLFPAGAKTVYLRMVFDNGKILGNRWADTAVGEIWVSMLDAVSVAPDLEEVVIVRWGGRIPARPFDEAIVALKMAPNLRRFALQAQGPNYVRSAERGADGEWVVATGWADDIMPVVFGCA
ncbi:hypothetical protein LTR85_004519 [Meristemomyces frigidus]|nr:hypothetical protein LTR85_004519 [Meristemomyces frigidus]